MSKKVCIFAAQYLPSTGGVERYTDNISRVLAQRNIEVTIVASDLYGAPVYEAKDKIVIYRIPSIGCMNNRFPVVKPNRECRRILKEIFQIRYDLVIVNTRFYPLSLVGAYLGKRYGKKCIGIEHGTAHLSVHDRWLDFLENLFEHGITLLVRHYIKDFYGVSEACNEWLKHFHINARGTLYNSINMREIEEILNDPCCNIRNQYHLPERGLLIAFTGRILKEKGIFQLVHVMERLKAEYPEAILVVAGNGPQMETVSRQAGSNVHFLGQISYEEIILLLNETDIFCLPSDSEGMPTSVLEALACKNFVITTKNGGAKEVILDSSYGIIIENNEEDSIYDALKTALDRPEYREMAVQKSFQRLSTGFTWEQVADKIEKLI